MPLASFANVPQTGKRFFVMPPQLRSALALLLSSALLTGCATPLVKHMMMSRPCPPDLFLADPPPPPPPIRTDADLAAYIDRLWTGWSEMATKLVQAGAICAGTAAAP